MESQDHRFLDDKFDSVLRYLDALNDKLIVINDKLSVLEKAAEAYLGIQYKEPKTERTPQ